MENKQYTVGNKYIIISNIIAQSNKYRVNKITIGTLTSVTAKCYNFSTDLGTKRIRKTNINKMIDISNVCFAHTQFFIDKIEGALI